MKQTQRLLVLFILAFMAIPFTGTAQYEKEWFEELSEEDYQQIEALALYPKETRLDILEVTQYPQAIIAIKRIQAQSSLAFQELLAENTEAEQKAIWDLTRYPGLIDDLANSNSQNRKAILQNYPSVIFDRANEIAIAFPDLLKEIQQLQKSTENSFKAITRNYSKQTSAALYRLIELPEVLSVLDDNIELSIMVGSLYKNNPNWVIQKSDSVHLAQARLQTEELSDWKNSIESNDEIVTEMNASAQQYAEDYGYDDVYYDEYYSSETEEDDAIAPSYYHPYSYWFGYPTWYRYPRWRPIPWWYDWGFYRNPNRGIVIVGLPSQVCINWYFNIGNHHYYYPHFSSYLVGHYYRHPRSNAGISRGVDNWRRNNNRLITDQWLRNKEGRVDRFRELGRMEKDRADYNKKYQGQRISKEDFLDKSPENYPTLKKGRMELKKDQRNETPINNRSTSKVKTQPKVDLKSNAPRKIDSRSKVTPKSKSTPQQKETVPKRKSSNTKIRSIQKGNDYHQNSWKQIQKKRTTTTTRSTSSTRKTTQSSINRNAKKTSKKRGN